MNVIYIAAGNPKSTAVGVFNADTLSLVEVTDLSAIGDSINVNFDNDSTWVESYDKETNEFIDYVNVKDLLAIRKLVSS